MIAAPGAGWPYPGDSPVARARRVAHAYRARLHLADPQQCADLDATMRGWGQTWAVPTVVTYDLDDWLSVAQAAEVGAVSPAMLRVWRHRGRIIGRQQGRVWFYQARDVVALAAEPRHRQPRNE